MVTHKNGRAKNDYFGDDPQKWPEGCQRILDAHEGSSAAGPDADSDRPKGGNTLKTSTMRPQKDIFIKLK